MPQLQLPKKKKNREKESKLLLQQIFFLSALLSGIPSPQISYSKEMPTLASSKTQAIAI